MGLFVKPGWQGTLSPWEPAPEIPSPLGGAGAPSGRVEIPEKPGAQWERPCPKTLWEGASRDPCPRASWV